jgi:hypothetical protein
VKFAVHKGSVWASRITLWFPEVTILNIGDLTGNDSLEGASHWFSDVEPPCKLGLWHTSTQTTTTLRRIRHIPNASWKMHLKTHCCSTQAQHIPWEWYPPLGKPHCFIVTPSVFSSTSWVTRRISDSEWFTILDIPDTLLQGLNAEGRRRTIDDTSFLPLGIITKLIDSFPSTDVERFCIDSSQPSKKICLGVERAHLENDGAQVPVYLWDEAIVPDGDPLKLTSLNTKQRNWS